MNPKRLVVETFGRKADIQTDRPRLSLEEIRTLFRKVRSNGVEPLCSGQLIPDSILRFSSAATGEMPPLNV
jgi:hypothetical protein